MRQRLHDMFDRLFASLGPQHWWPGQTRFEVCVGAILTQNTNWSNVEKAINNLRRGGLLEAEALLQASPQELAGLIRPAGYFNQKALRLLRMAKWLVSSGGFEALDQLSTHELRRQLLSIKGIGPETGDSILLYAFERPVFVVDAYTVRVLLRHNMISPDDDYHSVQEMFHDCLDPDVRLFNEFHALLVNVGKNWCHKREARCRGCPLEGF